MVDTLLFIGYVGAYLLLFIFGIQTAQKHGWKTLSNVILLVIAALIYDNAVLALGRFIGEGSLLEGLSYPRFYLHAFFTPLLTLFAFSSLRRARVQWAFKKWVEILFYTLTISLILYELLVEMSGLDLAAHWEYGVLSYGNAAPSSGPPLMVLIVSVVLIVASIFVWRKQKWPWFFVGTAIMFIGNAIPIPLPSAAITNAFELILLVSLFFTKKFQDTHRIE